MIPAMTIRVTSRNLERALKALQKGTATTRADMEKLGEASKKDARTSISSGKTPDGKPWRRTKDGRQAYGGSSSMRDAIKSVVISSTAVRVISDDIRSSVANRGRSTGLRVNLSKPAIVPLTRSIARRVARAGGWRHIRAFRITTKGGKILLAERLEGKRINFLGVFKKTLKQYRRQHFGEGRHLRATARELGVSIAARLTQW